VVRPAVRRLIEEANDVRGIAAHYREQGLEHDADIAQFVEFFLRAIAGYEISRDQADEETGPFPMMEDDD
jgi:hypothetical protein